MQTGITRYGRNLLRVSEVHENGRTHSIRSGVALSLDATRLRDFRKIARSESA
jgi:hypothetical protein